YADLLSWDEYWHTTLDTSNAPFWKWFVGGKLNASYNCVDRHLAEHKNKAALIWVPEPEDAPHVVITYQELYRQVNEFAALLRDFCGVKAGDRVTLHMPMVPELPVVMLACARLGVIHSQVFGGFSGGACGHRHAVRPGRIAERLGVNIFHTSPTAIRMLRKVGPDEPAKYDYHFKHMTTVGEAIEPEVWRWYYETVGKGEAVIVDTWWQTETGGFLGTGLPALYAMKPGSCGPAALGIYAEILDESGEPVPQGSGKAGNICIRNPWPGIFETIWGQPDRFVSTYFAKYNKDPDSKDWRDWPYFAGDGAVQTEDGYYRILGRVDDVINVAGHRLGTKELESSALAVEEIAEAAAVPVIDDVRGGRVEMSVSLKPGIEPSPEIEAKVKRAIETDIGKIARPKNIWIVPDMPKT